MVCGVERMLANHLVSQHMTPTARIGVRVLVTARVRVGVGVRVWAAMGCLSWEAECATLAYMSPCTC